MCYVELFSLARGTTYMCKQRVERNEEYIASDFFYSAIVVLVERGLLHGHITRNYKRTKGNSDPATSRNLEWATHAKQLARQIGLCCKRNPDAQMQHLNNLLTCTGVRLVEEEDLMLPDRVCTSAQSICKFVQQLVFANCACYVLACVVCYPSLVVLMDLCACVHV